MMDIAAADDMTADAFLEPSVVLTASNGVALHLCRAFYVFMEDIHVILRITVFTEGNSAAFAVADLTILDDPAAAPVGTDHAVLI